MFDLNTSQESFTDVLDLVQVKFSHRFLYHQVDYHLVEVLKVDKTSGVYKILLWQRLTLMLFNDVFFFMVPTGSTSGVTPQLIQNG